ncbi:DsbE family thiol:disulfide interchange protein [Chromohalobacter japonicus]|uniref:DsbE family thiol:disulfide interchange protein n=1 Tax=Chromohalobacter japonicus TaxID=223900 RepID=UPI001FF589B8|nr:DsbE family thiol:disulfide interchange protein [Chromohalobacter japonicus]MCK0754289.1 DsbE family thiol:disulfide interchange protein [Chromohalobacter japonicus]
MKRRLLLLIPLVLCVVLVAFLYRGLASDPKSRDSALIGKAFPQFQLSSLSEPHSQLDRSLLKGEVTVVNIWGEWCPVCKKEMPQLHELADKGVRVVGVDYKDTRDKGNEFLDTYGNPFEVSVFDPKGSLGFDLGVYGAPESFIVDANGTIRYHHTGFVTPEDVEKVILPEVEKWQ